MKRLAPKVIALCIGGAFIAAGLFPPWTMKLDVAGKIRSERSVACYAIFSPPKVEELMPIHFADMGSGLSEFCSVKIDQPRLLIEWACILAGGLMAWVLSCPIRRTPQAPQTGEARAETIDEYAVPKRVVSIPAKQADSIEPEPKSTPELAVLSKTDEKELGAKVLDFVNVEFSRQPTLYRTRAVDFIQSRVWQAALRHFSQHQSLRSFPAVAIMRELAAEFRGVSGRS